MKIYTKVGDGGDTFLFGGRKVRKDDPRVAAYGDVDELNSLLGWAMALSPRASFHPFLKEVQETLFVLGADLATPRGKRSPAVPRLTPQHTPPLEKAIDRWTQTLPPLRRFILPGGSPTGAALHVARAVARRAERSVVGLLEKDPGLLPAQIYLNRLSDALFVLARTVNRKVRVPESEWRPR